MEFNSEDEWQREGHSYYIVSVSVYIMYLIHNVGVKENLFHNELRILYMHKIPQILQVILPNIKFHHNLLIIFK